MKIAGQWLRDILGVLYQRPSATREDLVLATGLNPACVSQTVRHLLEGGVLHSAGRLRSTGGRRTELLKLNSEAGYFAAVDLEGTRARFALTSFLGDIRFRWEEEIFSGKELELDRITGGIHKVIDHLAAAERRRFLSVGVSYTGLMDGQGRVSAYNLRWNQYPLVDRLGGALDFPVFFGSDNYCKMLGERWLGVARECEDCVYILCGVGVGAGMMVNGHMLSGSQGMAGEFGHLTIDPSGPDPCNCGKRGCLEAIVSSPNIVRQYRERSGSREPHLDAAGVFARARSGDAAAAGVVARAGRYLGLGVSHLVNLLNPALVVLGGDLAIGFDVLREGVEKELAAHALPLLAAPAVLRPSALGADAGLRGAAALAFRHSLEHPDLLPRMSGPVEHESRPRRRRPTPVPVNVISLSQTARKRRGKETQ